MKNNFNFYELGRDCGSVPTVHNGTMQNSEGTKFNDRTSYTCNEGTMISPGVINTVFLCRGDGSWSKPDQTCVGEQSYRIIKSKPGAFLLPKTPCFVWWYQHMSEFCFTILSLLVNGRQMW